MSANTKPTGRGRPTKYLPEYAVQAEKLCKLGATNEELADFFGVNLTSIHNWRRNHPEFSHALKRGKLIADAEVAEKLYRRATGYSHEAVKIFLHEGQPIQVPYIEHYPPDTTACIFWLKNRQPGKWRDKVEVEAEVDIRKIPWEELRKISDQALAESEKIHQETVKGRAERLGLKIDYTSDTDNEPND